MTLKLLCPADTEFRVNRLSWRSLLRRRGALAAPTVFVVVLFCGRPMVVGHDTQTPRVPPSAPLLERWRETPDEPISTDRPDFTESTDVVPRGWFQLEGGYTYTWNRSPDARSLDHTFPEFLLRVGLLQHTELRIGWEGLSLTEETFHGVTPVGRPRTFHNHDDGATDLSFGIKQHLLERDGLVPDFSVIAALSMPTGGPTKSSGDVDPEIKLLWGYPLTEKLTLSGNANVAMPSDGDGRFLQPAASVSLAYSIAEWMGAYVEYFGFYPNERDEDCAHYANGGFTFPIAQHLQFDVRVGAGLNEEADDLFTGFGFAIRF